MKARKLEVALPSAVDIEVNLIGMVLAQPDLMDAVATITTADHFSDPDLNAVWSTIMRAHDRDEIIGPLSIGRHFGADSQVSTELLFDIVAGVIVTSESQAIAYANILRDIHIRRCLIDQSYGVAERASMDDDVDVLDLLAASESGVSSLYPDEIDRGVEFPETLAAAVETTKRAIERREAGTVAGVATGLAELDHRLGGLHPADLIILAARPSMGKTTLAKTIALNAAMDGVAPAIFSLEMSKDQIGQSFLASLSAVSVTDIRRGLVDDAELARIESAAETNGHLSVTVDDHPGATIGHIRSVCRRLKRRDKLDLVVVDYLQLISGTDSKMNRVLQLAEITRGLKRLAKELDVPVLALSQLSRQVEYRDDKRPMLSDLRDSGAIEQDADVVLFLYRHDYYLRKGKPTKGQRETDVDFDNRVYQWKVDLDASTGKAEIIVDKQRLGPVGTIEVGFDAARAVFMDDEITETGGY